MHSDHYLRFYLVHGTHSVQFYSYVLFSAILLGLFYITPWIFVCFYYDWSVLLVHMGLMMVIVCFIGVWVFLMLHGWLHSHLFACLSWIHVIFDANTESVDKSIFRPGLFSTTSGSILCLLPTTFGLLPTYFGLLPTYFWLVAYYFLAYYLSPFGLSIQLAVYLPCVCSFVRLAGSFSCGKHDEFDLLIVWYYKYVQWTMFLLFCQFVFWG